MCFFLFSGSCCGNALLALRCGDLLLLTLLLGLCLFLEGCILRSTLCVSSSRQTRYACKHLFTYFLGVARFGDAGAGPRRSLFSTRPFLEFDLDLEELLSERDLLLVFLPLLFLPLLPLLLTRQPFLVQLQFEFPLHTAAAAPLHPLFTLPFLDFLAGDRAQAGNFLYVGILLYVFIFLVCKKITALNKNALPFTKEKILQT